jgi:hypothetical protein
MTVEIALQCFPATVTPVRAIWTLVHRSAGAELEITFWLDAEMHAIRLPPPAPPVIATHLWQHTCFEAFVAMEGQSAYHELNFAPSGEWAAYAFRGYRQGCTLATDMPPPLISMRATDSRLELKAILSLGTLSAAHMLAPLRLGLSAVVEDGDGVYSYWALHHPADKPDFHHADSFALRLAPPHPQPARSRTP